MTSYITNFLKWLKTDFRGSLFWTFYQIFQLYKYSANLNNIVILISNFKLIFVLVK